MESLADALVDATAETSLLAGGTDLMLTLRARATPPDLLIDLSGMHELAFIGVESGVVRIGAMTTFAQIESHTGLASHAPCLVRAAAQVGSRQIRNLATIGGNVCNASPCADGLTALLALDAQAAVLSGGHVERRPLRELLNASGGTRLRCGQAITEFSFLALSAGQRSAFAKVGSRSAVTVSKLNAAVVVTLDAARQNIAQATVSFGSIAPIAFMDREVSAALCGQPLGGDTARHFAAACAAVAERSIPNRSSLLYKRHAIRGLALDLWNALSA